MEVLSQAKIFFFLHLGAKIFFFLDPVAKIFFSKIENSQHFFFFFIKMSNTIIKYIHIYNMLFYSIY